MNSLRRSDWIRLFWILLWLVFTVTFAIWWFQLSSQHIELLRSLQPEQAEHWDRQRRMISWEGTAWIILLVLGGAALVILAQRETQRAQRIREFFASFSHEIKTSLASLRLQAEALKEEITHPSPILDRLIGDTVRLQVQLENSLFFASQDNLKLYVEAISLPALIERMREHFPQLEIQLKGEARVLGDDRALRTIFSNLLQNAVVHGGASLVQIEARPLHSRVSIEVKDNGRGFSGESNRLGELFHRPTAQSGSGLGLYICRLLIKGMGGHMERDFASSQGFRVRFDLPGEKK